jgi:hypothetical protein
MGNLMICKVCNIAKDETEFNFKYKERGIRSSKCRPCQNAYSKQHYMDNKQVYIKRAAVRNKLHPESQYSKQFIEYKKYKDTLSCEACGESDNDVLHFHHPDPSAKEGNVSNMVRNGQSMESIKSEISKCMVVCANCHAKIHWNRKQGYDVF